MDQVYIFNKPYQERLQEFKTVLGERKFLSVSQLKKEWSNYLKLAIEPSGWRALWKIPRIRCEELNIEFPTIVVVYVENIDFAKLSAIVTVLAIQSGISLPSKNEVGLVQLWVTREQDSNFQMDAELIANCLDMLHFFYINLLFPWDYEDDDNSDWISNHLETRLQLFYNMRNGTILRPACERLKWLLNKARRLQSFREQFAIDVCNIGDTIGEEELLEAEVELLKIQTEVQLLENPLLCNVYLKRCHKLQFRESLDIAPQHWLIINKSKFNEYIELLGKMKDLFGNKNVKLESTLHEALEAADIGDTIILSRGKHSITDTAGLPSSVVIKGLYSINDTIIHNEKDGIMLDCFGNVTLENLTIYVNNGQCGITIRNGNTIIRNCKILGNDTTSLHRGVIVQPGSSLHMINCEIGGFYLGLFGSSQANITLQNCIINHSVIGLQIGDGCSINITDLEISNCLQFGIFIDTLSILTPGNYKEGGFSLLEGIPELSAKNIKGNNIGNCDTIILHSTENLLIDDLFCSPILDHGILEASNDKISGGSESDNVEIIE